MSYLQEELITNIDDAEAASPKMVFGFGERTRNRQPQKTIKRPKVTTKDLRCDAALLDLFRVATRRRNAPVKDCPVDLLNVFAAAERAMEHGDDPPALFVRIMNGRLWHLITDAQEDRAQQRLRRLRNWGRDDRSRQVDDAERCREPHCVSDVLRDVLDRLFPTNGAKTNDPQQNNS